MLDENDIVDLMVPVLEEWLAIQRAGTFKPLVTVVADAKQKREAIEAERDRRNAEAWKRHMVKFRSR